jgi:hypothetical protein
MAVRIVHSFEIDGKVEAPLPLIATTRRREKRRQCRRSNSNVELQPIATVAEEADMRKSVAFGT